ncbi:hypothetical protein BKA63DRAFT_565651 [Paraphoma chrysanthemicola]|nr:hypothetical protein BKA63DRAFT_565651 [Paraphoma chrysanthemicola]
MSDPTSASAVASRDATAPAAPAGVLDGPPSPPQSPAESDKTVVGLPRDDAAIHDIMPDPGGSGRALFSTNFGARPPRDLKGQSLPPVIVHSNKVEGVVQTALTWRLKFLRASLCIFPNCGWKIEDLWDAEDIHLDTPEHCKEVLFFLSWDNVHSAKLFAEEYSRKNPQRVIDLLGQSSMEGLYDPNDPAGIVDKVFVKGEINKWPRPFLWHAAHIMRGTMIEVQQQQKAAAAAQSSITLPTSDDATPTGTAHGGTTKLDEQAEAQSEHSMTSMKQEAQPALGIPHEPLSANASIALLPHRSHSQVSGRAPSHGPLPPDAYHGQPVGYVTGGMPPPVLMSPSMSAPALRNPKGRSGQNNGPQVVSMHENFSRGPSRGYTSRPTSGAMSNFHSPHMNPASMMMAPPLMGPPHTMQPIPHGYVPISPSGYAAQPFPPTIAPPGFVPGHPGHIIASSMQPAYIRQPSNNRASRGMSIGNMTNNPYYVNNVPPQNMDVHQPNHRRNSFINGIGSLFDPYNGTRPAFNDHSTGRKYGRGNHADQPGRSRKFSSQESRPRTASYEADRPEAYMGSGSRYAEYRTNRSHMVNDMSKISNTKTGCYENWIGPDNHDVNELFVKDLPTDVRSEEIKAMFKHEVGIEPCHVTVKYGNNGGPPHAFALFNSTSDAKMAIRVIESSPRIRGTVIRVTVPRRFFQMPDETSAQPKIHLPDAAQNKSAVVGGRTRKSSYVAYPEVLTTGAPTAQPLYSPQDARSDLQKKDSQLHLVSDPASTGSPTSRKRTPTPAIPTEEPEIGQDETQENTVVDEKPDQDAVGLLPGKAAKDVPAVNYEGPGEGHVNDTSSGLSNTSASTSTVVKVVAGVPHAPSILPSTLPTLGEQFPSEVSQATAAATPPKPLPRVKIPPPPATMLSPTKQASEPANSGGEIMEAFEMSDSQAVDCSEGEGEPDSSFLSAQETISSVQPTESPSPNAGPVASHVEQHHATHPSEISKMVSSTELSLALSSEALGDRKDSLAEPKLEDQAKTPQATGTQMKEIQTPPIDLQSDPASQLPGSQSSTSQNALEQAKKHGPQQTTSLNPFAKPSKAQRQKEKEQQKKEKKKKEQKGKDGKAKLEKVTSTASLQEPAVATFNNAEPNASQAAPTQNETQVQSIPVTNAALIKEAQANSEGKGNAKARSSVKDMSSGQCADATEEEVSGKLGGTTITDFNDTGSVTKKAKVSQQAARILAVQVPRTVPAVRSPVQSLSPVSLPESDQPGRTTSPVNVAVKDAVSLDDVLIARRATTTTKKAPPAVPNLKLYPRKPSIQPSNILSSSKSTPETVSNTTSSVLSTLPPISQDMSQFTRKADAVSIASSDTLHPDEPSQTLHSPTAEDFYTPLQTPAAPAPAPAPAPAQDSAPKTKKKNKKKKKKAATGTDAAADETSAPSGAALSTRLTSSLTTTNRPSPTSPGERDSSTDPFDDQMAEVDSVRKKKKDSKSSDNQELLDKALDGMMKMDKEKKDKSQETSAAIEEDHWRHIQAYIYENQCLLPNGGQPIQE